MRVTDLTEELLRCIEFRELERVDIGENIGQRDLDFFMSSEYKKAVLMGDQVAIALGGKMNGDLCHTWMLASDLIYKNPVASLEVLIELEAEAYDLLKPRLLFTYNLPEFPDAIRFLKRVGYREVRTSTGFEDGKDRILLVKEFHHGQ